MKGESMKNWLKQTSTIGGFISLIITGLHAYQSGGDVMTSVLAVLSGALLLTRDGKFLAGLAVLLFVGNASAGCASISVPKDVQVKSAITVGCSLMEQSGCFSDVSIQAVFPCISSASCPATIEYLVDSAEIAKYGGTPEQTALAVIDKIDLEKFDPFEIAGLRNASCSRLASALGVK